MLVGLPLFVSSLSRVTMHLGDSSFPCLETNVSGILVCFVVLSTSSLSATLPTFFFSALTTYSMPASSSSPILSTSLCWTHLIKGWSALFNGSVVYNITSL